jgi:hypothetical protein
MNSIDRRFLALGATYLVAGMIFGIVMGIKENFTYATVHAHINLVGFSAHCLFGLAYRVWPNLKSSRLAGVQFWLFVLGTPVLLVGIAIAIKNTNPAVAIVGSLLVTTGALLFMLLAWSNLSRPQTDLPAA